MLRQIAPVALVVHGKSLQPLPKTPRKSPRKAIAMTAGQPPHVRPKPPAPPILPAFQRARLRAKVAAITCSEPWTDLAADRAEKAGLDPNAAKVASQLALRGIYPPPADPGPGRLRRIGAVRMRRCDACGRIVPPNNMASNRLVRLCDDCRFEPDVDPDEIDQKATCARAPGAHLCVLMRGLVEENANRGQARDQLSQLGLSDPEITALALTYAGYATRRIAESCRWSQAYVRKLLDSAARKLRRCGLKVPKAAVHIHTLRYCPVDPAMLDGMNNRLSDPNC